MVEMILGFVLLLALMASAYSTTHFIVRGHKNIPLLKRTLDAEKTTITLIVVAAFIWQYLGGWEVISLLMVLIALSIALKHLAAYYHRHRSWHIYDSWRPY